MGITIHVSQLGPLLKTFTAEAIFLMREHVQRLPDIQGNISDEDRNKCTFLMLQNECQDLLMVPALMADTYDHPLPIVDPDPPVPLSATHIYTDAKGNIGGGEAV